MKFLILALLMTGTCFASSDFNGRWVISDDVKCFPSGKKVKNVLKDKYTKRLRIEDNSMMLMMLKENTGERSPMRLEYDLSFNDNGFNAVFITSDTTDEEISIVSGMILNGELKMVIEGEQTKKCKTGLYSLVSRKI